MPRAPASTPARAAYAGWIDKTMRTNSAPSVAARGSDLAETGTTDGTATVVGASAVLIAAGGGTVFALRRRKPRPSA
ncbi:LAETG motif-containing sortase-dependent surface protein [Streptomyces nogalater]